MATRKTRSSKYSSKKLIVASIFVVVIAIIAVLELTNTTHLFHSSKAVSGNIPVTSSSKTESSLSKSSQSKPASSDSTGDATSDITIKSTGGSMPSRATTSSSPPETPYGSFVSTHRPSLSSSSGEQSSCISTPGAVCTITFTNEEGVVKTLPAKITDSSGNAFWDWNVSAAEFTPGNWTIKATAALNGQTQSATDKLPLNVRL